MNLPPHLYWTVGLERKVDEGWLRAAMAERARLVSNRSYPLISLGQLAHESGASYSYLREVVSRERDPYRSIAIPKRGGSARAISAPEPIMMDVQRWILGHVLGPVDAHPRSFAYEPGRSVIMCAQEHVGSRWMIKVDLHDFFGTVNEIMIYRVFRRLGYAKLLAFELSRLTTRAEGARRIGKSSRWPGIPAYSVDLQGSLPQGGPSSGMLANAAAFRLDRLIDSCARENELVYTRYSDDIVLSGHGSFSRSQAVSVLEQVFALIRSAGFVQHRTKTRIVPPGARKIVLGLLVDESVRLLPEQRRLIEVHLRGIRKFGIADHASHRGFESALAFINHLDGWISFVIGVDRDLGMRWRKEFNEVLVHHGVPIWGAQSAIG